MRKKRKGLFSDFIAFINKGNALALAIGVIIGGAFGAIVTAINVNIISPLIAFIIGDSDLSDSLKTVLKPEVSHIEDGVKIVDASEIAIKWGAFIQAVIDFLLIAIILFVITKIVSAVVKKASEINAKVQDKVNKKIEAKIAAAEAKAGGSLSAEEKAAIKEEVAAEAEAPVEEVKPDMTVELLSEIRDLLKKNEEK